MRKKVLKVFLWSALAASIFLNFFSALSPELGFDALWYHLTLPKLYLSAGKIYHVTGGLLYYSEMPRLAEFLYIPLLYFFSDTGPHLLNFFAGLGATIILYKLSRRYISFLESLLVCVLFYSIPLVGWQSGSAYVDLLRTFFEVLAFYLIIQKKHLFAGIALGLAISTKTLALGSIFILSAITFLNTGKLRYVLIICLVPIILSFPWFLSAYNNTGFPFYPIGSGLLDKSHSLNPLFWILPFDYIKLFIIPQDIISPIYVIFLPFLFFIKIKERKLFAIILLYFLLSIIIWFVIPRTGGGRFILPYLPVWSFLIGVVVSWQKSNSLKLLLICLIIGSIFVNILYRGVAVSRNISYLTGKQTKIDFLCSRLDFNTSVFVDCDGFFKKNIKPSDLVLIKDIHNLYYVDFPFVHESWLRNEKYNYILTGRPIIGKTPIYKNSKTRIYLYKI